MFISNHPNLPIQMFYQINPSIHPYNDSKDIFRQHYVCTYEAFEPIHHIYSPVQW